MTGRDTDGYSLLELLVALALTAVIATMMVAVTRQLHPLRLIQAKYDAEQIATRLVTIVGNDLQSAIAVQLLNNENMQPMIGGADQVRFVGVVRTGFATEGLREVSYHLKSREDGTKALVRIIGMRRFADADRSASQQTDDLFDPVQSLVFRYMERDQDGAATWLDHWNKPSAMPSAIRITIGIGKPDVTTSASMVVTWE